MATAPFEHLIRVRFSDCDMQGVAFNANYLVWADDVMDVWLHEVLGTEPQDEFDYLVKKATLEWSSPARLRDVIRCRPTITRWGNASLTVVMTMDVGDRRVADCEFVLVSLDPVAFRPQPIPSRVRALLDGPGEDPEGRP